MIKLLDLLQEGKRDAIIKFVDTGKISNGDFNKLLKIDTTKTFKYIELICYLYYKLKITEEELNQVFSVAIENLESKKARYDIQKIKTESDYDDFKSKVLNVKYTNSDLQQYKNMEGSEVVYEDKRCTVLRITTKKAAIALGKGTAWCISRTGKEKNEFTNYMKHSYVLYFVFDNTKSNSNNLSKLCIVIDTNQDFVEIKSKDQSYNGKEHTDYPESYLTDNLGLKLGIFKWIDIPYVLDIEYKDSLTNEIAKSKFPWLFADTVSFQNAVIGYKEGKLIWYEGEWYAGAWMNGTFKGSYFGQSPDDDDGTPPVWYGGEWEGGKFNGKWKDPNNTIPLNVKEYRDGLTYEIIKKKIPWLLEKDIKINDAIIGYQGNKLIWYNGVWLEGTWKDGIWYDGWFNGTWKGGIWQLGYFYGNWKDSKNPKPGRLHILKLKDGLTYDKIKSKFPWLLDGEVYINNAELGYKGDKLIFYKGDWNEGIWIDGIFKGRNFKGKWLGGDWGGHYFGGDWQDKDKIKPLSVKEYKDGLTYEIIKKKFPWLLEDDVKIEHAIIGYKGNKLIWYDGNWYRGTWKDGIWKDGNFYGNWKDGIWEFGNFKGEWEGGIFKDGIFTGEWDRGEWQNGTFKRGPFKGEWLDGSFEAVSFNGIWRAGTWNGRHFKGKWYSGTWNGGEFDIKAEWLDPNNPDPRNT